MNERIRKLAIEAGIISAEYNGFDPTGLTKAQRKFAELIVRECIHIDIDNPDAAPGVEIAKHFGIE